MSKEQERIDRLQRRLDHLNETLAQAASGAFSPSADTGVMAAYPERLSYVRAEASALTWVIALAELALSNWPSGIQSVRDMEKDPSW